MPIDKFMKEAIEEAKNGLSEGGIPIGSILVYEGKIIGRGHNQRIQKKSAILHAEMDCLESAGRLSSSVYKKSILYSTLSPCDMCSGSVLLYGIPKVIVGENRTFQGPEAYLISRGVELMVMDSEECKTMMDEFINSHHELWNEDIGK